ncbi:hypothetical protein H5410_052139 [Solanum commersonii]|uniref:Uncharacterized protein n=1 Tax=Solanum commersonii TaxID=4109 RepID=A0A9J5X357_SOLCO|nr:hypothetical protein H5410_052139 [Solanum commersonii]
MEKEETKLQQHQDTLLQTPRQRKMEVESQKENNNDKHSIKGPTQNPGMTAEAFSDNQSLLQQKEMHVDMNCQKYLEVFTKMMDLNIENNDVNENKDHEQENEQNTLFPNKSTKWDKDRQSCVINSF